MQFFTHNLPQTPNSSPSLPDGFPLHLGMAQNDQLPHFVYFVHT